MRGLHAQAVGIGDVAGAAAALAGMLGVLVAWATFRASRRGKRGDDIEKLTGVVSSWSERTIDRLEDDLAEAEKRCDERLRMAVAQVRAEFETKLAIEGYRVRYWRARALGEPVDDTPPPHNKGN